MLLFECYLNESFNKISIPILRDIIREERNMYTKLARQRLGIVILGRNTLDINKAIYKNY